MEEVGDVRLMAHPLQRLHLQTHPEEIAAVQHLRRAGDGSLTGLMTHAPTGTEVPEVSVTEPILASFALWFSVARGLVSA